MLCIKLRIVKVRPGLAVIYCISLIHMLQFLAELYMTLGCCSFELCQNLLTQSFPLLNIILYSFVTKPGPVCTVHYSLTKVKLRSRHKLRVIIETTERDVKNRRGRIWN